MKKIVNAAFIYALFAMAAGVFYREFTKFYGFEGKTTLAFVHTHLFTLGMILFFIVLLLCKNFDLQSNKKFKLFYVMYNIGVPLTASMLVVRGIFQIKGAILSAGMDGAISGISGLAHALTGLGLVFLILALKQAVDEQIKTI